MISSKMKLKDVLIHQSCSVTVSISASVMKMVRCNWDIVVLSMFVTVPDFLNVACAGCINLSNDGRQV